MFAPKCTATSVCRTCWLRLRFRSDSGSVNEGPSWYPNSHNVVVHDSLDNKLHEGTKFSWDTFGVHIESTVHEFVPSSRIGWWGLGTGMKAYHTFLLIKPTRVATSSPKRS